MNRRFGDFAPPTESTLEPRAPVIEGVLKRYLEAQKRILEGVSPVSPEAVPESRTLNPTL